MCVKKKTDIVGSKTLFFFLFFFSGYLVILASYSGHAAELDRTRLSVDACSIETTSDKVEYSNTLIILQHITMIHLQEISVCDDF